MDNKPILHIAFWGFWDTDEVIFEHYFKNSHRFLWLKYDVRVTTDLNLANVVFCSVFGNGPPGSYPPPRTGAPKIMLVHENTPPGSTWFDVFDHIISFSPTLTYKPNHYRIPYWVYRFYEHDLTLDKLQKRNNTNADELFESRRFCNFVYSNPFFFRREFAHKLSSYRQVDFGGKVDHNISEQESQEIFPSALGSAGLVQKTRWLSKYRFTIAFENSSTEGYTTEKILDAFVANTIPLYWGNLRIKQDGFNPGAFLNYFESPGDERFVGRVKAVDGDRNAYMEMINQPVFSNPPDYLNPQYMLNLYEHMIERK